MVQPVSKRGTIIGGGSFFREGVKEHVLAMVDLDAEEPKARLLAMRFLAHGVCIDPQHPDRAVVFEKKGPGACYVDLRAIRVIAPIPTPAERHFYGHGAYSADGTLLYATESYLDDDFRGALVVRDAKTFAELGTVPTFGAAPHDCMLLDDGRTMVVTNGGGPLRGGARPSVTYVDVTAEKLLEKVELKAGRFNAGHIAMTSRGDFALVSAPREGLPPRSPRLGAVSLKPAGKPIETVSKPKAICERMKGETLSVLIDERDGTVIATHPEGDMVTMWQLETGKLIRKYDELHDPRGVALTLDRRHYVVSHLDGTAAVLSLLSTESRELDQRVMHSFTSGSHIFVHDLAGC